MLIFNTIMVNTHNIKPDLRNPKRVPANLLTKPSAEKFAILVSILPIAFTTSRTAMKVSAKAITSM